MLSCNQGELPYSLSAKYTYWKDHCTAYNKCIFSKRCTHKPHTPVAFGATDCDRLDPGRLLIALVYGDELPPSKVVVFPKFFPPPKCVHVHTPWCLPCDAHEKELGHSFSSFLYPHAHLTAQINPEAKNPANPQSHSGIGGFEQIG